MTTIEIDRPQNHVSQLRVAMREDLSNRVDTEGRSALDFLITQIQRSKPDEKREWKRTVSKYVSEDRSRLVEWWNAFERFVVLGDLVSPELGNALEHVAAEYSQLDPSARANLYTLLDVCGRPPSASIVGADQELRSSNRLKWLDLMISRLPRREDAQILVLDAAREGHFKLDDFVHRLNEMRELGGPRLSDWLKQFGGTLSAADREEYDLIVDKAFGPLSSAMASSQFLGTELKTMRELALSDPHLASLPIRVALKRYESAEGFAEARPLLALMQKATSFNQSCLVQYQYLCAEKHKKLKEEINGRGRSTETIKALLKELLNFSNKRFHEATLKNFEFLNAYFAMRGPISPRVCLKGNFRSGEADTVVSIFRDHPVNYESDTEIEKNTGFHSIKASGTYFIENDIPKSVIEGRYVNPRIDSAEIQRRFKKADKQSVAELDLDWRSFWRGSDSSDTASFYKSTMIVPLTLFNNEISSEFKKGFESLDVERSIFGFLCFDHREADYFDRSSDVFAGKIFADILCTYAFTRLVFTDFSRTFQKVIKFLREREQSPRLTKLNPNRVSHQIASEFESYLTPPAVMQGSPKLLGTDQMLLNYVRSRSTRKQRSLAVDRRSSKWRGSKTARTE
jgi:hypothetical protein